MQPSVAPAQTLKISEIFASVQGEGSSLGTPSVFVRLALCNLACTWCDTPYTWDWSRFDPGVEVRRQAVSEVADAVRATGVRNVVITGGEPLLQQPGVAALIAALGPGFTVEVETAGTIAPSPELVAAVTRWNVSPKLAHSGNAEGKRVVPAALAAFAGLDDATFKVVVRDEADVDEAEALLVPHGIARDRILLMPEGTDAAQLLARSRTLAEVCVRRGFRLTTRLHVLLWGDVRGT